MSEVNCCRRFLFKMSLLVSIDELFWPIVLCALYVAVGKTYIYIFSPLKSYQFVFCLIYYFFKGPWFIGYIIDESIGICFVWGIILAGNFLPGGLTYFVGTAYVSIAYYNCKIFIYVILHEFNVICSSQSGSVHYSFYLQFT